MTFCYKSNARYGGHFNILLIGFLLFCCPARGQWLPYFSTELSARSETTSISDALTGWNGDFDLGETQYLSLWLEAGLRNEHWGIGTFHRQDYGLWFSKDAAELFGSVQNGLSLEEGREYDIWLEVFALQANGVRLFWLPKWHPKLKTTIGLSLLKSSFMLDGTFDGTATALGEDTYSYTAWVDYNYTFDLLFEREVEQVYGYGASLDLALTWQFNPQWLLDIRCRDLFGAIWWESAPFTQASAYSERSGTSDSGYTEWDPAISGLESYRDDYWLMLPATINSDLYYSQQGYRLGLGGRYQFEDALTRSGVGSSLGDWDIFLWWWHQDNGVELSVDWRDWHFNLTSDSFYLDQAKLINFSFSFYY